MLTRIQLMCMTDKTKADYYGEKVKNARPDYSIHYNTDKRHRSKDCTVTPRQREGATYAGGRHLRRAHARLSLRLRGYKDGEGNKPGSMK